MKGSVIRCLVGVSALTAGSVALMLPLAASSAVPRASVARYPGALLGVSGVSRSDAWAVGGFSTAGGRRLILHWNGSRWAPVTSPDPGNGAQLTAVSARSASDAWAVGSYCTSGCGGVSAAKQAFILRWNGTSWKRTAIPPPRGAISSFLSGVTALSPDSAWAVGSYCPAAQCYLGGPPARPLILHWNGAVWRRVASPDPGGRFGTSLNAVTASSATSAWAVGSYGTRPSHPAVCPGCPGQQSLVLHWNGRAWAQMASPSHGLPPDSNLTGVSATSPSAALAVGWSYFSGRDEQKSLALRWNGTAWRQVASPNPGPPGNVFAPLYGVSALSPSSAWAVGSRLTGNGDWPLMLHWNGTSWVRVANPSSAGGQDSVLTAVSAVSRTSAWAVGHGREILILHWNGSRWARS
jgi:hypothetical protein